jgi:phosphate ABC transporter phosphate-binding protein
MQYSWNCWKLLNAMRILPVVGSMPTPPQSASRRRFVLLLALFLTGFFHLFAAAQTPGTQTSGTQQSLRTLAIAPLGSGDIAAAVRSRLIARLKKNGGVRVVEDEKAADAVLHGNVVIWPIGTVSNNPRSNTLRQTNYRGYLSVELSSSSHQAIWSYLVMPSRFRMGGIADDLADSLSARLLEAIRNGVPGPSAPSAANNGGSTALRAAGSTFAAPLYLKWFESFAQEHALGAVPIVYDAVGSIAGVEQLIAGKVDMAASDIPWTQGEEPPLTDIVRFPTVVGGVVPVYNLPGAGRTLHLTPQLLADIYSGKIRRWNDSRIRQWNSGVRLPDAEISVVHRSDGSGTTWVWTSYLAEASPEWKIKAGAGIEWPVGVGVAGSEGVVDRVAGTPNSIGYVELTYAIQHQLSYAAVRNPAGKFIRADLASITAAAVQAAGHDLRLSVLNTPAGNAYPITTFTWFLVPKGGDPQKRAAIAGFLRWMLTTGQKQCSELGYAPLPREVVSEELRTVNLLK